MEIAMAPDSIRKMKKYITERLENSGHFRTKAAATRMLSDLNRLKLTAIDHIKDGEEIRDFRMRSDGLFRSSDNGKNNIRIV